MLKQSQKRTKRAALAEASMSRQPASSCGWFATMPTVAPSIRPKPVMMFFAYLGETCAMTRASACGSSWPER